MATEKPKPADISTEAANAVSRETEFHTVSPISPLFEESGHDLPLAPTQISAPPSDATQPAASNLAASESVPPKPPRPLTPQQQAVLILAEAFPTVEPQVIKAVLIASRGETEPAFNALLAMTDPTFVPEEPPAPAPPSRSRTYSPRVDSRYPPQQQGDYNPAHVYQDRLDMRPNQPPTIQPRNQVEADEIYARQLAEHYNNVGRQRGREGAQNQQSRNAPPRHRRNDSDDDYTSEKEHSFLEDDLPVIKENIRQGFLQTQSKVNRWVAELKKKIDGEPTSPELPPATHDPRVTSGRGGPSGYSSYDADPRVLGDDFAHLELRDNTEETPPKRPPRPVANPNLFQSSSGSGNSSGQRKVAFQDIPDDELYMSSPRPNPAATAAGNTPAVVKQSSPTTSKWQPLKSVEPTPLDGDPFSLGDSEDERDHGLVPETKQESKGQGAVPNDKSGAASK